MSSTAAGGGGGSSLSIGVIVAIAVVGTVVMAVAAGVLCAYLAHQRRLRLNARQMQQTTARQSSQVAVQQGGLPIGDHSTKAAARQYFNTRSVAAGASSADSWSVEADSAFEGTGFTWWWRCRWRRWQRQQGRQDRQGGPEKHGADGELPLFGSGDSSRVKHPRTRNKLQRPRPAAPKMVSSSNFAFVPVPVEMPARSKRSSNDGSGGDAGKDGVSPSKQMRPQRPPPPPPQLRLITHDLGSQTDTSDAGAGAVPHPANVLVATQSQQELQQGYQNYQNYQNFEHHQNTKNGQQFAGTPYAYAGGPQQPGAPSPSRPMTRPVLPVLDIPGHHDSAASRFQRQSQPQPQPQSQLQHWQQLQLQQQLQQQQQQQQLHLQQLQLLQQQQYQQSQRMPSRPHRSLPQNLNLATDSALSEILRSTEKRLQQLQAQAQTEQPASTAGYTGDDDDDVFAAVPTLARQRQQCLAEEAAAREAAAAASAMAMTVEEALVVPEAQKSQRSSQESGVSEADSMFVEEEATTTALSSPSRSPTRTTDQSSTISVAAKPPTMHLVPRADTAELVETAEHEAADASTSPDSGSSSAYSPLSTRSSLSTVYSADERPEAAKEAAGLGITMSRRSVLMQLPVWQQQQQYLKQQQQQKQKEQKQQKQKQKPQGVQINNGIRGSFGGAVAPILVAPAAVRARSASSASVTAPLLLQPSRSSNPAAPSSAIRVLVTSPTANSLTGSSSSSPGKRGNVTLDVTDRTDTAHVHIGENASATAAAEEEIRRQQQQQQQQQQRRQSLVPPPTNLASLVEVLADVPENGEAVGAGRRWSTRPLPVAPSRLSAASLKQQQQQEVETDNRASTMTTNSLLATAVELRRMNSVAHSEASTVYSEATNISPLPPQMAVFPGSSTTADTKDEKATTPLRRGRRSRVLEGTAASKRGSRASGTGSRHYLSLGGAAGSGTNAGSSSSDKENGTEESVVEGGPAVSMQTTSGSKRQQPRPFSFVAGQESAELASLSTPRRTPSRSPSKTDRSTSSCVVVNSNSAVKTPGSRSPTKNKSARRTSTSQGTPTRTPTQSSPGQRGSLGLYDPDGFLIYSST